MSVSLHVRFDAAQAQAALRQLFEAGADLRPMLLSAGRAVQRGTWRAFDAETAPSGTPWTPSLRAREDGGKTLYQRGHLRRSITVQMAGANAVEVGSNLIYAAIHQTGGVIRAKAGGRLHFKLANGGVATVASVTIPARPYLGLSDRDSAAINGIAVLHLRHALGGA